MYSSTLFSSLLVSLLPLANAAVTIYNYEGAVATSVSGSAAPAYTGLQAYNPITLSAPPLPNPAPSNAFNIALHAGPPAGLSIKLNGSFCGFSIEFSVLNQVCE